MVVTEAIFVCETNTNGRLTFQFFSPPPFNSSDPRELTTFRSETLPGWEGAEGGRSSFTVIIFSLFCPVVDFTVFTTPWSLSYT